MWHPASCRRCRRVQVPGEPDPCLGYIPGVVHACCGHSIPHPTEEMGGGAYVVVAPGYRPNTSCATIPPHHRQTLRGEQALAWFAERGVGP